jgi:hypothetical protein
MLPSITTPAAVMQLFKGGVYVYDTVHTTARPVPTDVTFVHANWVRVFGAEHAFVGDYVITALILHNVTA